MRWNKDYEFLTGLPEESQPDDFRKGVEEPKHLSGFLQAFNILTNKRQIGMGIGGIPLIEIEAYCRIHGIDDIVPMVQAINTLDEELIRYTSEQTEKKSKK